MILVMEYIFINAVFLRTEKSTTIKIVTTLNGNEFYMIDVVI